MRVCVDIEANALKNPTKIWVICAKDIDTGESYVFTDKDTFKDFSSGVHLWIGHNFLGYDYPVLLSLGYMLDIDVATRVIDTFIISKLVDYPREKHSIENYGEEFGIPKRTFTDFTRYSTEMVEYCTRDVDICHRIYDKYKRYINNPEHVQAIALENKFQLICNQLHNNGFYFNKKKAEDLLIKVEDELGKLDKEILTAFPPKEEFVRKIRRNKDGSINRVDTRYFDNPSLYSVVNDDLFSKRAFNPASHKQLVDVLHGAGWQPSDRTKTHTEWLRDKRRDQSKLAHFIKYGWKINETNLLSLPASAPAPARTLAKRILYESRRRTLTEWINLVSPSDGRIHGEFQGIGAWTHRMSHQKPNTANIPNETDEQGRVKLLGGDLRQLWGAPKGRLLIGCDAEGIQLRIFAHYINDPEFTKEVSEGDPHTLNQRVLGSVCRTRQAAKRFIYALLLGAGLAKLGDILECDKVSATGALDRIMSRYTGFSYLKENVFPSDIKKGWFEGLDGRKVTIPNVADKPHLVMSGYLQNGEAVCMKRATLKWMEALDAMDFSRYLHPSTNSVDGFRVYSLVDLVHDEWQTECPNNMDIAKKIGQAQCDALRKVGEELKLNCPLAGSFYNKKKKDYTIGTNWRVTH